MNDLYINCQPWQLDTVRSLLIEGETVGTDSYCFRENTYVINTHYEVSQQREAQERHDKLCKDLRNSSINIPMQ